MADFNLDKGHFITAHRKDLRFSMKMMFAPDFETALQPV